MKHLYANLLLLGLTIVICCVAYPAVLWGVGQVLFPSNAAGSLVVQKVKGPDGTDSDVVRGSRLIAPTVHER